MTLPSSGEVWAEAMRARDEVTALRELLSTWLALYEAAESVDDEPAEMALVVLIRAHAERTRTALGGAS